MKREEAIKRFKEFLREVYCITIYDYYALNDYQRKSIDIDWKDRKESRYGKSN